MPPYSTKTYIWHTIRIAIIAKLCQFSRKYLISMLFKYKGASMPKLITAIALLTGYVAYRFIQKVIDQFLL